MSQTLTKKNVSTKKQTSRVEEFLAEYCIPFEGTNKKPYDVSNPVDEEKRPTEDSIIENIPTFEEYIKSRKSRVVYREYDLVRWGNVEKSSAGSGAIIGFANICEVLFVERKTGFVFRNTSDFSIPNHSLKSETLRYLSNEDDDFNIDMPFDDGSQIYTLRGEVRIGAMLVGDSLLINADEEASDSEFVSCGLFDECPCVSFACLANLISGKVIISGEESLFAKTNLKIVDSTLQETKKASPSLNKDYKTASKTSGFRFHVWAAKQTPPSPGFSLIENGTAIVHWHKSPTVLISTGKKTFLMGQDEGTYFGCILSDNPKSIEAAYTSLMPKNARGVKGVLRQGEWFAIPVKDQKSVPSDFSKDIILRNNENSSEGMIFGLEDEDSNHHVFDGELIITKDGKYFARNFNVSHDEHATLVGENDVWYTFERNTAIQSFSAEKVD